MIDAWKFCNLVKKSVGRSTLMYDLNEGSPEAGWPLTTCPHYIIHVEKRFYFRRKGSVKKRQWRWCLFVLMGAHEYGSTTTRYHTCTCWVILTLFPLSVKSTRSYLLLVHLSNVLLYLTNVKHIDVVAIPLSGQCTAAPTPTNQPTQRCT